MTTPLSTKRWLAILLILTAFFLAMATFNLENFRPVSSDEGFNMAVADKLAADGILGSDLFAGFFNADQHIFFNMPLQHVWQALVFRLLGAGVAQARWVSLINGVVLLWTVCLVTRRWYGNTVSLLTGVLLLFWRTDLIGASPGLPLLALSRTARYDVGAVMWIWLAIGLLDRWVRQPSRWMALALGMVAGLGTLTHFTGFYVWPLIGVILLGKRGWACPEVRGGGAFRTSSPYLIALGGFLVILPYLIFIFTYFDDFSGQFRTIYGQRAAFGTWEFYLTNLTGELARYRALFERVTPGPFLLILGVFPALLFLWRRLRKTNEIGDRILFASFPIFLGMLSFVEQTKAPGYAFVFVPSLCILFALCGVAGLPRHTGRGFRWAWRQRQTWVRQVILIALCGTLGLVILEGGLAYWIDRSQARQVSAYEEVGAQIEASLPEGARILGTDRWWWPLRTHSYLAFINLVGQWLDAEEKGVPVEFSRLINRYTIHIILVNDNVRGEITRYPEALQSQFWAFIENCTIPLKDWTDKTYGRLEVYKVAEMPAKNCVPELSSP